MQEEPILEFSDFTKQFLNHRLEWVTLRAVMLQEGAGGECTVANASRLIKEAEKTYSALERVLVGIVWAVD